jgi:propanol-preferring alcohol dehydrogenase
MKAVRLVQPGQPLELQEVPLPSPGPHDVLVRVRAAGICHSDAHYRAGKSRVHPLPLTLGHEVAGLVEQVGGEVKNFRPGDRVCLHYLATCGECEFCRGNNEQFCPTGQMIGKYRDGGYAEFILMPARSVFPAARFDSVSAGRNHDVLVGHVPARIEQGALGRG